MKREVINIETMGLHDILSTWAKVKPESYALIYEGTFLFKDRIEKYTYRELDLYTNKFANVLLNYGVKKGDRIAIYLPNCPEFIISYLGIFKVGGVVVPLSPIYTQREVSYQLNDTQARIIVTASYLVNNIDKNLIPELEHIILIDEQDNYPFLKLLLEKSSDSRPEISTNVKSDIALIPYTSGTTGIPKGVPHTHYHYTWNLKQIFSHLEFDKEEIICTVTPLFHVTGYHDTYGVALFGGWPAVILERFDPQKLIQIIEKYKVTYTLIPTAGLIYMLNIPDRDKYDIKSIKGVLSGGSAVPVEVGNAFIKAFDVDLIEAYGATEILVTHINPISRKGKIKFGSVGITVNNNTKDVVTKIVDETDSSIEKPSGEVGEIIIKCPCSSKGYWNKSNDSDQSFRDGYWYSGDIGYLDNEGYLYITDRKKDMINVSGFKCWPREVEEVIHEHPSVAAAVVVGKKDQLKGEVPVAFIELKPGMELDSDQINDFVKDKLAKYKIPVQYIFIQNIPRNPAGKANREELKKCSLE